MICYKDMTFCDFYERCKYGYKCDRALTPEVKQKAIEWWGKPDSPVAKFITKPGCFNEK